MPNYMTQAQTRPMENATHRRHFAVLLMALAMASTFLACEEKGGKASSGEFTDARDGKKYKTVKIGSQTWMAENLNYKPSAGYSLCYDNKESNCDKYGRLYDFGTAEKACPSGWHLSSDTDWSNLVKAAGGAAAAHAKLKAKSGWSNGNGTDDFGFSALPGGNRLQSPGKGGSWWSKNYNGDGRPDDIYGIGDDWCVVDDCQENIGGFSVRCVKD
jgi:uncharacterized protein (TIGR02145 family)